MLSPDAVAALQEKLNKFGKPGSVPLPLARRLIEASAWWHGHPQSPTRAPKHSERVVKGPHGWELPFGGNYFLVERAVICSKGVISEALDQAIASNSVIDAKALRGRLGTCIRESVANYNHERYDYYQGGASPGGGRIRILPTLGESGPRVVTLDGGGMRPSDDACRGFMHFGVQAIKVDDFVKAIWKEANLNSVCA